MRTGSVLQLLARPGLGPGMRLQLRTGVLARRASPCPGLRTFPRTGRCSAPVVRSSSTSSLAQPHAAPPPLPPPCPTPPPPSLKWPLSALPARTHPYLLLTRLDKPTGTLLLFLPCTWSIALAAHALALPPSVPLFYTALFGAGALVMRGAGCTVNDMWDRRLDRLVDRTRSRPLAAGTLAMPQATVFLGVQLLAGLAVLTQLNTYSILLGAASLPLVFLYPTFKRLTHWPQAILGLTFNWGTLLGWAALAAPPAWAVVLPLYAAGWCWTIVYDTVYAHQDKADDAAAGIGSTALLFGARTAPVLAGFGAGMLGLLAASGWAAGMGAPFYAISVGGAGVLLARILRGTDWESRESCWDGFAANTWVGVVIAAGIWGEYLWERRWVGQPLEEAEEEGGTDGGKTDGAV